MQLCVSLRRFEEVRDRIAARRDTSQLKECTGIASMVGSVQANVQDDLASAHARLLAAGEGEIDGLFEVAVRQGIHLRRVPVVDLARTGSKRLKLRHRVGSRRPIGVRHSLQVVLKDPVDHMDMIEDTEHERGILLAQPVEIPVDHIVEAATGPPFDGDELGVRQGGHWSIPRANSALTLPFDSQGA